MATQIEVPLVTKIANSAKTLIALVTSGLIALGALLPDGTYKVYAGAGVAILGAAVAWWTKNAATVNLLATDLEDIAPQLTKYLGAPVTVTVQPVPLTGDDSNVLAGADAP